jgi:hypothetical protein
MFCDQCGTATTNDDRFCTACGVGLTPEPPNDSGNTLRAAVCQGAKPSERWFSALRHPSLRAGIAFALLIGVGVVASKTITSTRANGSSADNYKRWLAELRSTPEAAQARPLDSEKRPGGDDDFAAWLAKDRAANAAATVTTSLAKNDAQPEVKLADVRQCSADGEARFKQEQKEYGELAHLDLKGVHFDGSRCLVSWLVRALQGKDDLLWYLVMFDVYGGRQVLTADTTAWGETAINDEQARNFKTIEAAMGWNAEK